MSDRYQQTVRAVRGLKLFSIDSAGRIEEVKPELAPVKGKDGKEVMRKKVVMQPGRRYCQALNLKNAERKFKA